MSKITEYTSVNTFDSGDVLLKDGTNGTKIIPVESAASEFLRLGGQNDKNDQIETALTNFGSNLAGLEAEYVATNDYAVGDFFVVENKLYKATADIADGDTIVPDTNCVETDISTEFKATKEIVDGLSEEIVKKANVDGYYTNLAAGTADQLMASQKVHNSDPYIFRTSGGASDIGNREELEIVGGSIVWNQLSRRILTDQSEVYGITRTASEDRTEMTYTGTATKTDNYTAITVSKTVVGHKVLITLGNVTLPSGTKLLYSNADKCTTTIYAIIHNTVQIGVSIEQGTEVNFTVKPQLFDLTAMFGSEIADHIYELEQAEEGAGVAWFRKYFPNDYYEYNACELMHVTDLQSHDTVGFNLFDKSTAVLGCITADGSINSSVQTGYVSDFIPVFPNTAYYVKNIVPGTIGRGIHAYDKDKNPISTIWISPNEKTEGVFTTPIGAWYVRICSKDVDSLDTMCLNLSWSGTRDGEYEPYVKHSYPLDSSLTLRGIPKLTTDGDLTYDGDIYKPDGTVERRYDSLFANGSEAWEAYTYNDMNGVALKDVLSQGGTRLPGWCSASDKIGITGSGSVWFGVNSRTLYWIGILDILELSTVAEFKTWLSSHNVAFVYQLPTPTTEQAEPYTSPQIVDDWGTEEFVTTSIVPVGHNTSYPANLRDKLQHLPDLPDDDGYYMTQVTGAQMSLIRLRIPQAPAEDGTYVLKATVTNGVPVYTWVDPDAAPETEEPVEP